MIRAVDQKSSISYNIDIVNNKEPTMLTLEQARAECEELHELGTMEPEDVYETVAHRNGMEVQAARFDVHQTFCS